MTQNVAPSDAGLWFEGALSLRRVWGSRAGRLPVALDEVFFGADGSFAYGASFHGVCELSLLDGAVREGPAEPSVRATLAATLAARGASRDAPHDVLLGPREGPRVPPAYFSAQASAPRRTLRRVVHTASLREVLRLAHRWPWCWSSSGRAVAYARPCSSRVTLVALETGAARELALPPSFERPRSLALDDEADALLVAHPSGDGDDARGALCCLDAQTGAERWRVPRAQGPLACVRPRPDGAGRVVWSGARGVFEARDLADGALARSVRCDADERLAFSACGRFALAYEHREYTFARLDLRTGERLGFADGPGGGVCALALGPDDRTALQVHDRGRARTRALPSGAALHALDLGLAHGTFGRACAAYEAGARAVYLAACFDLDETASRCVRVPLDVGTGTERSAPLPLFVDELRAAPDGSAVWALSAPPVTENPGRYTATLLSADLQRALVAREVTAALRQRPLAACFAHEPHTGRVLALLVDGAAGTVEAFDPRSGASEFARALRPAWLRAASSTTGSVRCSADGERVYLEAVSERGDPRAPALWSAPTLGDEALAWRRVRARSFGLGDVVCMGDAAAVVEAASERVEVYSLRTGALVGACGFDAYDRMPRAYALARDERTLVLGSPLGLVYECALDAPA